MDNVFPVRLLSQLRPLLIGFRKSKGLTQRELSEKIGLDQWKLLVKMKDSSFTDEEKETIKRLLFFHLEGQLW